MTAITAGGSAAKCWGKWFSTEPSSTSGEASHINLTGELNDGANVNGMGGSVLIQNTALAFPQDVGTGGDLSLNVTQRFGERVSLSIGKFDMINAPSRTPILGGGGLDTFWNIAFAAPPSGVLPPYMTGGNLSISTKPGTFTFMLYDPTNAQQKAGLNGWGTQGITGRISARFPAKIRGLQGFHTLTFAASSQTGLNLEDIPQLVLPPESGNILRAKTGYYFGSYAVQQYFHQDKSRPGNGWGLFAQASISDSNPNPLAGNVLARYWRNWFLAETAASIALGSATFITSSATHSSADSKTQSISS